MDRTEIIEIPDKGVFRVKYHQLNRRSIRNMRSRLQGQTWKIRQSINLKSREIEALKAELKEKETRIDFMTEARIKSLVDKETERQKKIQVKANVFLKTLLGQEQYAKLQEKGYFVFKGLDGNRYRIKSNAELQQASGKNYWMTCCKLSFESQPLPDFIASVFVATTNDPEFLKRTVRNKTDQVVID